MNENCAPVECSEVGQQDVDPVAEQAQSYGSDFAQINCQGFSSTLVFFVCHVLSTSKH